MVRSRVASRVASLSSLAGVLLPAELCALAALSPAPAVAGEGRLVAVLEFRSKLKGEDAAQADATYLSNVVRTAALESVPGLRVMTRENMLVLLGASGKSLAECEGECEVDTGRRLGADLVVSGEVLKFGSKFKLDLRMHDTKDGRMISGAQASGKTVDELDDALAGATRKLFASLAPAAPVVAAAPAPAAAQAPAPVSAPAPAPQQAPAQAAPSAAGMPQERPLPPAAIFTPQPAAPLPAWDRARADSTLEGPCGDQTGCFAQKQCKEEKSCSSLAHGYDNAAFGLPQDGAKALALYGRGCAHGDVNGCMMAMNKLWQGTTGVAKDLPAARAWAAYGCDHAGWGACNLLTSSLEASAGDKERGLAGLEKGCRALQPDACWYLAQTHLDRRGNALALAGLETKCAKDDPSACYYLKQQKVDDDAGERARAKLNALCKGGNQTACSFR
jgi:TolB-like protein